MTGVWIVNPFDNLPTEGCRPQRYWLMAQAFASAGCGVTLFTSDFSHAFKRPRRIVTECDGGFAVEMLATSPYPVNVCWRRIYSHRVLARNFTARARALIASGCVPKVIIASTPPLGLCAAALDVARECGARFVCDIQDAWPETFYRLLPRGFGWCGRILFAPMHSAARRIYREADMVSGVSARYAQLCGRGDYFLSRHGIVPAAEMTRKRTAGRSRLVYAGNLGSGYDLATVLRTLAVREDLELDIAGLGPNLDALKSLAGELGLGGRVRFHGYLGEGELATLLMEADIGVIPMRDDSWVGLPYKLCDYLAAGLHIVSSLHGECGELLVRTGFGTCYEWGSVQSLSRALDGLGDVAVTLPDELRASSIYPAYADRVIHPLFAGGLAFASEGVGW